jgi:mono/diheme cytochrome c family protein
MQPMTILAAALMCGAMASAHAESFGRPQQGQTLAQGVCAECHAVQKGGQRSPNVDAPPFAQIASTPGVTTIALSAALQTSHRTMPNIVLQSDEMIDVIAYILSLKDGD